MRTSLFTFALFVLVPSAAYADVNPTEPSEYVPPGAQPASKASEARTSYVVPRSVLYQGGDIPSNAHIETKPDIAFIATGVSTFASAYVTSLVYGVSTCGAQTKCRAGSGWLYLPLVGPFITSAQAPTTGGQALAAFDGGVQALGLTLAIVGFVVPRKFVTWQSKLGSITVTPGAGASALPSSPLVGEAKPDLGSGLSVTLLSM